MIKSEARGLLFSSNRASLIFGIATAAMAVIGTLAVLLLAVFDHPYRAVVLLGGGITVLGFLRALWPGRPWFSSRNRWLDVTVYVVVGLAIIWLSPWTAAVPPA